MRNLFRFLFVLVFAYSFVFSCQQEGEGSNSWVSQFTQAPVAAYFSYPGRYVPIAQKRNVTEKLLSLVESSKHSILLYAYSFDHPELELRILEAIKRGVHFRMIGDREKIYPKSFHTHLSYWGGSGLQHTKVLIIDSKTVFLGTGNFTSYGLERDHNGYIVFDLDATEVDSFLQFLEERYALGFWKKGEFIFRNSPSEGRMIQFQLLNEVQKSSSEIRFLIFDHYDPVLTSAFYEASKKKTLIFGIYDRPVDPEGLLIANSGNIEIREDGNEDKLDSEEFSKGGLLHHKTMIIDRSVLLTGSYNYSASARDSNREIFIKTESPVLTIPFLQEWQRIYASSNGISGTSVLLPSEKSWTFGTDAFGDYLCRNQTGIEEVFVRTGIYWFQWVLFFRFSDEELCKYGNQFETISSSPYGGKLEFSKQHLSAFSFTLLNRKGELLFQNSKTLLESQFEETLSKPFVFLRPDHVIQNDSTLVWSSTSAAKVQKFLGDQGIRKAWLLARGKNPLSVNANRIGNVWEIDAAFPDNGAILFFETSRVTIVFCAGQLGNSPEWANRMLLAANDWSRTDRNIISEVSSLEENGFLAKGMLEAADQTFFSESGKWPTRAANFCRSYQ
ncbi:phospholipase D-like domain-containing protein [Leptospira perolatii]|nr:phospholipase D-like domain-containing protein [Leptospira perolatii]